MPQRKVNIRSIGDIYRIVKGRTGELLGKVDEMRVFRECHPGAIYLHRGTSYEILSLDTEDKEVLAREKEADYYTQPTFQEGVQILSVEREVKVGESRVRLGPGEGKPEGK